MLLLGVPYRTRALHFCGEFLEQQVDCFDSWELLQTHSADCIHQIQNGAAVYRFGSPGAIESPIEKLHNTLFLLLIRIQLVAPIDDPLSPGPMDPPRQITFGKGDAACTEFEFNDPISGGKQACGLCNQCGIWPCALKGQPTVE